MTTTTNNNTTTPATRGGEYFAFFLDRKGAADLSIWKYPVLGPYLYDGINGHGNEWYDFLHDRYELWICDFSFGEPEKIEPPDIVLEEIKRDFARDAEVITLKHKYYGKWLAVRVVSIDCSIDLPGNCDYYLSDVPDDNGDYPKCDKPESPNVGMTDERVSEVDEEYIHLCDEHYGKVLSELEEIKKEK
jgi:hypothetical protein